MSKGIDMAATVLSIDTIVSDPRIRGGRPVIAGTGIRVMDIVAGHIYHDYTPEEIAVNYKLDVGQVYAALAYYYMHKAEIDTDLRASAERAEKLLADLDRQGKVIHLE
jgi:uncharacterized protein (DUF433 family)